MKKLKGIMITAVALVMGISAVPASADIGEVVSMFDYEVTLDYYSQYVWRGQQLNESSFQPGASIAYGGLSGGFWGNVPIQDAEGAAFEFTEADWWIDYTTEIPGMEWASISVGAIYYNFASTPVPDTTEVYWGFSFDAPLSPYVMVYHDIDQADGMYINTGISYAWEDVFELIPDKPMDLEISASMGWGDADYNTYYWSVDDDALNDFNLSLAMPMELGGGWTMTPSLTWTAIVDNGLRDSNTYDDDDNMFYVGVGFAKSF